MTVRGTSITLHLLLLCLFGCPVFHYSQHPCCPALYSALTNSLYCGPPAALRFVAFTPSALCPTPLFLALCQHCCSQLTFAILLMLLTKRLLIRFMASHCLTKSQAVPPPQQDEEKDELDMAEQQSVGQENGVEGKAQVADCSATKRAEMGGDSWVVGIEAGASMTG